MRTIVVQPPQTAEENRSSGRVTMAGIFPAATCSTSPRRRSSPRPSMSTVSSRPARPRPPGRESPQPGKGGAQFATRAGHARVSCRDRASGPSVPIQWMDRNGKLPPLRADARHLPIIRSLPTAAARHGHRRRQAQDVWVYEWARDTLSRLTFDRRRRLPGVDAGWSPHRVRLDARGQGDAEPLLAAGGWNGRGGAADREQERSVPESGIRAGRFLALASRPADAADS